MIEPKEADIGRKVIYRMGVTGEEEEGVITSFTHRFVFVRYGSDATSRATRRADLSWAVLKPGELKDMIERMERRIG